MSAEIAIKQQGAMSFELSALFSLSIGISVIIGWARFFKTDPAFLPFLLLVTLAFTNEIISYFSVKYGYTNIINFNTFQLFESLLLTWQFMKWGLFDKRKWVYYLFQLFFILSWIGETALTLNQNFYSYFIIVHSFIIIMMSISMINRIVLNEIIPLIKHPVFLICIGLICFFTYAALVECFWIVGFNAQRLFRLKIYQIMAYINLITNIIFALAFLWVPMRPRYIMRS
jgi:hypothetical protein